MASASLSREEVVDRIAKVFRDEGYEAASLMRLSKATGLGKASLYYHFPEGKEAMALAVIQKANTLFTQNVIEPLQDTTKAEVRIAQMIRNLDDYYCHGKESCLLGVLAMSATPAVFHGYIKDGLITWVENLTRVLQDYGLARKEAYVRAESAVCMVEGALLLARGTADPRPFSRVLKQLKGYLLATPSAA